MSDFGKGRPAGGRAIRTKPLLRKKEKREYFPLLLLLSIFVHATLILLIALCFARHAGEKPPTPPEPPPPEVTLEIPPPDSPDRPFVEAKEIADKAPENAPFQSDENTKAASELPAAGTAPLPTQQGVTQTSLELRNQRHTEGEHPASSAGNPSPATPPQPTSPPTPPQQQSQPQEHPAPQPAATSKSSATPQPTPLIPPPPNSVKLLELPGEHPTPSPSQSPVQSTPPARPPTSAAPPGTPGSKKGYQAETRQTVIMGSISNRGRSSVAAAATPIGKYKKAVADAIGSRWYYYVNERMGLLSIGTVSLSFKVTASGKVTGIHVISTNSNESLTDCSLRSIMDAKLPPIPPDVASTLQDGSLEIDYSFTIY
jgi:outer membrane biosynthesis protein TonB